MIWCPFSWRTLHGSQTLMKYNTIIVVPVAWRGHSGSWSYKLKDRGTGPSALAHKSQLIWSLFIKNVSCMRPARAMTTKNFISRVSVDLVPPLTSCNFLRDSQAPCPLVRCLPRPSSQLGAIHENTCLLDLPSSIL